MTANLKQIKIDIVSDIVCPWCFVGKKKLEKALDLLGENVVAEINWRPFQLSPEIPEEGIDYRQHLIAKFGSSGLEGAWKRLTDIGTELGIPFAFEKIEKAINTLKLHVLISSLTDREKQNELAEILFKAHFEEGIDLNQQELVWDISRQFFESRESFDKLWMDPEAKEKIREEITYYHKNGISGVPYFIFQDKYAVSGAQNPEVFLEVMETIWKEEK